MLEPLGPYVSDSSKFEEDDFYPQALDAFRWKDELMCLPQNISSLVLYYNKDLFKRFNVPPPRDGMRWNELVVKAQQLTRDKNGQQVRGADPDMPQAGTTTRSDLRSRRRAGDHQARSVHLVERRARSSTTTTTRLGSR